MLRRILIGMFLASISTGTGSALTIRLDQRAVVVGAVQPSGRVLLFGAAHERPDFYVRLVPIREVLVDQDGDSTVTYDLRRPMPRFSVWLAVDLGTGAVATASGDAAVPAPSGIDATKGVGAGLAAVQVPNGDSSIVSLVRPRVGAWTSRLEDGGIGDTDGAADGVMTVSFAQLQAEGNSPSAPATVIAGDLLAVIDLRTLTLSLARL